MKDDMTIQSDIDQKNSQFWDELCGSQLARSRGIIGRDHEALQSFDQVYLVLYPYLLDYVPVRDFSGGKVLEIGLGYGTLSQQIAQHCAEYRGLDIAAGPVNIVNHRLSMMSRERLSAVQCRAACLIVLFQIKASTLWCLLVASTTPETCSAASTKPTAYSNRVVMHM